MVCIYELRCEYKKNPLGIDCRQPRFSWKLRSDLRDVRQISYQIVAFSDEGMKETIWDSGIRKSQQQIAVLWDGNVLHSGQRVYWQVKIETKEQSGNTLLTESELQWFEMGLLEQADWRAKWIEPEAEVDIDGRMPAPYLRKEFCVRSGLKRARIYQTAHGLYEFWINGTPGTEDRFTPGFTSYYHRLQYQTYDITEMLEEGNNCWSAELGDGWWRGNTGGTFRNNFGYRLAFLGQILLEYADGTTEWIVTDDDFHTATGALTKNDMKEGETYQASAEPLNWKICGFDDSDWRNVKEETDEFAIYHNLIASRSVPVREKEIFYPIVRTMPNGDTVLDFGQNIAGYVQMKLHNPQKGQRITLYHGEALDENGNFTQKNIILENPEAEIQKVTYIAAGEEEECYKPSFAILGFQYVLICGCSGELKPEDFAAIAVYSDMGDTGDFGCSNPLLNKLVSNSRWSQKGNFMEVPTDCPTRERSPWTGDSHIYAKTASRFMDVYTFFEKWMADLPPEQFESGKVPNTFPRTAAVHNPMELERKKKKMESLPDGSIIKLALQMTLGTPENGGEIEGSAGLGDAAVILPYVMYLCYGDKRILENQYDAAKRWVNYIIQEAEKKSSVYKDMPWYENAEDYRYIWDVDFHFGEWCEPDSNSGDVQETLKLYKNPDYLTATMYYFHSSDLLSKIAAIIGKDEDAAFYAERAAKVKAIYNKYFIRSDGVIREGRQAPNVRALAFGLANPEKEKAVAKKLAAMITENGYKLNTGFLSTVHLLPTLVDNGYTDLAYRVLEQTQCPSWLFNVKEGATTILENWDGFVKHQNSFNHYSYGAVCDFLFEYTAGIRPMTEHPGYKEFILQPVIGGTLTTAKAELETHYGRIRSEWKVTDAGRIEYTFSVPVNTKAHIILPGMTEQIVGSGDYAFWTDRK